MTIENAQYQSPYPDWMDWSESALPSRHPLDRVRREWHLHNEDSLVLYVYHSDYYDPAKHKLWWIFVSQGHYSALEDFEFDTPEEAIAFVNGYFVAKG